MWCDVTLHVTVTWLSWHNDRGNWGMVWGMTSLYPERIHFVFSQRRSSFPLICAHNAFWILITSLWTSLNVLSGLCSPVFPNSLAEDHRPPKPSALYVQQAAWIPSLIIQIFQQTPEFSSYWPCALLQTPFYICSMMNGLLRDLRKSDILHVDWFYLLDSNMQRQSRTTKFKF